MLWFNFYLVFHGLNLSFLSPHQCVFKNKEGVVYAYYFSPKIFFWVALQTSYLFIKIWALGYDNSSLGGHNVNHSFLVCMRIFPEAIR